MEDNPLVLAAKQAAAAYVLLISGHVSDNPEIHHHQLEQQAHKAAISAAEVARDLFNRHLAHLERLYKERAGRWREDREKFSIKPAEAAPEAPVQAKAAPKRQYHRRGRPRYTPPEETKPDFQIQFPTM